MREVIVGSGQATKYAHVLVGGKISSGKTSFGASAPRPLFFADVAEGGFKVLEKLDRRLLWDSKVLPTVWAMENMLDYPKYLGMLFEMVQKGTLKWGTLIFDSLSIYSQRVLRELKDKNPGQDGRQRYGDLGDAISSLVFKIHTLPMHVIWLCHTDDEDQLTVGGKAAAAAWAYMDSKFLVRVDIQGPKINYQMHTKPFRRATWIGSRGPELPDPMIPSFKYLAAWLGLPEKPVSPALPPFNGVEYWNGL